MRIFADTADLAEIERLSEDAWVSGYTTNPTLYKNTLPGARYSSWAKKAVELANGKSISIDGPVEKVWELGENAVAKVCVPVNGFHNFNHSGPINYTAICTQKQLLDVLAEDVYDMDIISIFAGRIMDTGEGPQPQRQNKGQRLWASTREVYNYYQARDCGFDIITMTPTLIAKMRKWSAMPLEAVAELTIKQFNDDRPEW